MSEHVQKINTEASGVQADTIGILNMGSHSSSHYFNGIPKFLTLLPAKNPYFTGRKSALKQLSNELSKSGVLYVINGIGGIGKSELAYKFLLDYIDNYQHVALFKFSNKSDGLKNKLYEVLKQPLFLSDDLSLDEILQRLQSLPQKCLFVFDNIQNIEDIELLKVLNINSDVIVTTRIRTSGLNSLNLDVLRLDDARKLFCLHFPTRDNFDDILAHIDYHPLFIELIAKTLEDNIITLPELRSKFNSGKFVKIDCDFDNTFNDFLIQRFKIEKDLLLKKLLQQLSILPSIDISFSTLKEIFPDHSRLKLELLELAKRGWLTKKDDNFKLHQVIKEFVLANHYLSFEKSAVKVAIAIVDHLNPNNPYLNPLDKTYYIEIINSIILIYNLDNNEIIAKLLDALCNIYYSLSMYDKAMYSQKKSLDIRYNTVGENHPYTIYSYNNLAILYKSMGDCNKAIEFHLKSLSICDKYNIDYHIKARSYTNIANTYRAEKEYEKAIIFHKKSIEIYEKSNKEGNPDLAHFYNNIAKTYNSKKNYFSALEFYKKSLLIHENIYGEKHPYIASSYNNISTVYTSLEDYDEAINYQMISLTMRKDILGEKHPDTANSYNNLAFIYFSKKEFSKSLKFHKKALNICKETQGKSHPVTAGYHNNIATVYQKLKICNKALLHAEKSVSIYQDLSYLNLECLFTKELVKKIKWRMKKAKNLKMSHRKNKYCKDKIE